jgi:hypothetical protein
VAGFSFFYFFANVLKSAIEISALTREATITASTAIS